MLKEEKMKNKIFISSFIAFVLAIQCLVYAETPNENLFNGLSVQSHVNKIYSNERKEELKSNILNYDDIDDLVHLYNPEILNNWNSFENNKTSEDVYNKYQDAADILFSQAGNQDSDMQEAMISAQGIAMQIQADKNADDSYTKFLTNYLVEKQLVLATKIDDLNYQKNSYQLLKATEAVNEAERKASSAADALKFGSGTQVENLTSKKAVIDARSSLISAESNQKKYKRNLLVNCGKPMSDDIYITPVDLDNGNYIESINLANDYQVALKNNVQYEIYRRKIENARTEEVKNENTILYESAPNKIYNDLENKYSNILDAVDTCINRSIAYDLAQDNLKKAKNEYDHGNISLKEYESMNYNIVVARNDLMISKFDLKIAAETYKYAVLGFGDC